ncbi:MAG: TonB-dependent receptor, partial [Acidovorax sp.]|nr:TonB-dependent receptor [Acidovorax sp.]
MSTPPMTPLSCFSLRTTAGVLLVAALVTQAQAQEAVSLPSVTVQSSPSGADMPARNGVEKERKRLQQVPGGTNLAEPQKEARMATLRDALDYQPGIVLQDFFG